MFTAATLAMAFLAVSAVSGQPSGFSSGNSLVRASVHAEHTTVGPDAPTSLALRFAIQPGWHTYWKNPGDTGAAMSVTYQGPEWAELGELIWPVPERYTSPGDLLDFVHEGAPILLAPLSIDREAWEEAGRPESLKFELDCEWFVCKDVCLLGMQTLSMELPVDPQALADRPVDPERASLFRQARQRFPVPRQDVPRDAFNAAFNEGRLTIRAAGATRLTFFPARSDAMALPLDSLNEGQREGDRLVIRYRDEASEAEHLEGVLVIERREGESGPVRKMAYEVRVPVTKQGEVPEQDGESGTQGSD